MTAVRMAFACIALSVTLALPGSAAAADYAPYASLYGGASFLEEADNEFEGGGSLESEFDTGFVVGGTAGVAISTVFDVRIELDLNYRRHAVDEIGGTSDVDGTANAFGALSNYWIDVKNRTPFTPYLGGGIGLAVIDLDDVEQAGADAFDDKDVVFAWQLGGGIGWDLSKRVTLGLDYRWFATTDPELENAADADFDSEYSSHNLIASLRYIF